MKIYTASRSDKTFVVKILKAAFIDDPQINFIIGDGKNHQKKYDRLMSYAFEQATLNGHIEISEDKNAVAIWRYFNSNKISFRLLKENILFLLFFGFNGLKRVKTMEAEIQKDYPKDRDFLYLWFLGTLPTHQGKGFGSALLNPFIEKCNIEKKVIYLETSTVKNVEYYKYKGFEIYKKLLLGNESKTQIYLMRKNPLR